jgi:hypothetical protein
VINFVCMPLRTSGMIRGRQVSDKLLHGSRVLDIHNVDLEREPGLNDVSLFVRTYDAGLAAQMKRRGHRVGYDVADSMCGDAFFRGAKVENLSAYAHPECDFYIVNNTVTLKDLEPFADNKPIYVVPHHTVNYERHVNRAPYKVSRVGYVGLAEQLSAKDEIAKLCEAHGAEFVSVHPNTREECVEVMKTIDLGVVFAEENLSSNPRFAELMFRHKPATKVTNFQSFGIPVVAVPYESYKEFGGGAVRFVTSKDSMLAALESFLTSDNDRRIERLAASSNGALYHIDEVVKQYKDIVYDLDALRDS